MIKKFLLVVLLLNLIQLKADDINKLYKKIDSLYINNKAECLIYARKLEKLSLKLKNDTSLAFAINKQANIYYTGKKFNKSIKYFEKELVVREKISSKPEIAELYYNLGSTCLKLDKFKKAKIYYNKSLIISKRIYDDVLVYAIYNALYVTSKKSGDYKLALDYLLKMQKIDENEYNHSIGLFKKKYFEQKQITRKKNTQLKSINNNLGKTKRRLYKTKKALVYTNDSLGNTINKVNNLIEDTILKNFEINTLKIKELLKVRQIEKHKYSLQKRNLIIYYLFGGFVFILIVSLLIFKLFLSKKKMNKKLLIQKNKISEQNFRINQSIKYGRKIQNAILPSQKLFNQIFKDYFVYYKPRDVVSGDFYWIHKNENEIWIAVVDCTGHGVPGAFMSMIANTLLNKIVRNKSVNKPSELLQELNAEVKLALSQNTDEEASDDGMDMSIIKIDISTKKATIAMANQTSFVITDKKLIKIEGDIFSIGGLFSNIDDVKFTDHDITLENSLIYMFSDGFQDQFGGEEGKKYSIERIEQKIEQFKHLALVEQKNIVNSEFIDWKADNEQIDDVLIIGIDLASLIV